MKKKRFMLDLVVKPACPSPKRILTSHCPLIQYGHFQFVNSGLSMPYSWAWLVFSII
jgi:hypothetical protein